MPKPIPLKHVIRSLKDLGFILVSQKGSHGKFRKEGHPTRTVIVKMTKKEIPFGTFQSIIIQSGIEEEEFRGKK